MKLLLNKIFNFIILVILIISFGLISVTSQLLAFRYFFDNFDETGFIYFAEYTIILYVGFATLIYLIARKK